MSEIKYTHYESQEKQSHRWIDELLGDYVHSCKKAVYTYSH
jgi:hypothetical protein